MQRGNERFVERLRHDPEWLRKGEEIRTYLQTDPTVGEYAKTLWVDLQIGRASCRERVSSPV
mgnify:CR=1 FL=1